MSLIIVTPPENHANEVDLLRKMFDSGILPRLHVRKPNMSIHELKQYINSIPVQYRNKVVLHMHRGEDLKFVQSSKLGGVHYPESRIPEGIISAGPGFTTTSLAYHDPKQLLTCKGDVDYVFLSPIFSSISKKGYGPSEKLGKHDEISEYIVNSRYPVFALGGCRPKDFEYLADLGFAGAALLGYVWDSEDPMASCNEAYEYARVVYWNESAGLSCDTF